MKKEIKEKIVKCFSILIICFLISLCVLNFLRDYSWHKFNQQCDDSETFDDCYAVGIRLDNEMLMCACLDYPPIWCQKASIDKDEQREEFCKYYVKEIKPNKFWYAIH